MEETFPYSENSLKDQLINIILVVTAVTTVIAVCAAEFRALNAGIGWSYRDVVQLTTVGVIVVLACFRNRLHIQLKAAALIVLLTVGACSGVYTLGMLGGTIWIFPTAAVIVAVFHSKTMSRMYTVLTISFCIVVAVRFCSGEAALPFSSDLLLSNPYHWFVYIVCMGTFFIIACVTIQNYREKMRDLIDKIRLQSDELAESNESLSKALSDVQTLSGMLPICATCKKIRDDKGYWNQIESYISKHSSAEFSHGLCPDCAKKLYEEFSENPGGGSGKDTSRASAGR